MFTRSAIFFPLIMAALLALVTFWVSQTVEQQGNKIDGSSRHDPDYTMNNFVTTQTDATGKLRYVLAAKEMVHFSDDDSTVLQRPRFTQYTTDKPYTQIESLRGYVSSNGEEVELVDNVKVVRQALENKGEMQVLTEKLVILPEQDLIKTDSPVVIKQAPKTVIHATGMLYNKKDQTVKLNKRVKVHYERPIFAKPARKVTSNVVSAKPSNAIPLKSAVAKPKVSNPPKASNPIVSKPAVIKNKSKQKSSKKRKVSTKKLRSKNE